MSYVIETLQDGRRALVLGMNWHTILGDNLPKIAHKTARAAGAHWYVHASKGSHALGTLKLTRSGARPKGGIKLYSAAAAFARAYSNGPVALQLELSNGKVWLVVSVDGVVQIDGDRILPNIEAASQLLTTWREKWQNLVVYADAPEQTLSSIQSKLDGSTQLRRANMTLSTVPPLAWVAIAAIFGWLAWDYGYGWYQEQERAALRASQRSAPIDAVAEWKSAIAKWTDHTMVHGSAGLRDLLASVESVPVRPGRWDLVDVDCSSTKCHANYKRGELGTSTSLRAALPAEWEISWPSLTQAVVTWSHEPSTQPLSSVSLPGGASLSDQEATAWQQLLPALTDVSVKNVGHVKLPAPVVQALGGPQAVAFPANVAGLVMPTQLEIAVNSPLRSLALAPVPASLQIERLHVRYSPASQAANLTSSVLAATLKGMIYAQ